MRILSDDLKAVLERGRYSQDRNAIPNSHKAIASELPRLQEIATALGVNFEQTRYTFTAAKGTQGVIVYSPYIGADDNGDAAIIWGDAKVALKTVKAPYSLEAGEKGFSLIFDLSEYFNNTITGDELMMSVALAKDEDGNKADAATLRKAIKAGNLGKYLVKAFNKPRKLSELEPGTYSVIGYYSETFKGETKWNILIAGQGTFKANTKLVRKLSQNPTITPEQPAALEVGESTETTTTGYAIIPVDLTTVDDLKIPVFDF